MNLRNRVASRSAEEKIETRARAPDLKSLAKEFVTLLGWMKDDVFDFFFRSSFYCERIFLSCVVRATLYVKTKNVP